MRNTLISTVGTSLFASNLAHLSEKTPDRPDNWQSLQKAYAEKNWQDLVKELLMVDPTKRVCGAEINTIEEVRKKKWISLDHIVFLVSDTEDGKNTGKVLTRYFRKRIDLSFQSVEWEVIEKLQDSHPKEFKINGLRNLIRKIGEVIQRIGPESVAIDATGGYKAQIALAVAIGQALHIPVYYKHERFSEIIEFPPLPISLDYEILAKNGDILTDFERGKALSGKEIGELDERLRLLLVEQEIEGEDALYELSPIGQIYLTGFRLRHPNAGDLRPATERERKQPTFGNDHHYPSHFKEFVNKVWRENRWIITAYSESCHGQREMKGTGFKVIQKNETCQLIGTYQSDFGARFCIIPTDRSLVSLTWAVDQLNQKYRDN